MLKSSYLDVLLGIDGHDIGYPALASYRPAISMDSAISVVLSSYIYITLGTPKNNTLPPTLSQLNYFTTMNAICFTLSPPFFLLFH